ncbi:hypothetical protein ACFQ67_22120 [Streptomyces sp. NPDC056488]|uniref:hypothetical protein n=1 Tax=unclassified Streptomyces TaxID=2593676 RepID=UPI00367694BC
MGLSGRFRTAAVTLPLLLAAVGCQTAGTGEEPAAKAASPTGKPVFEERLDDQLSAASRATAATGSARFTATLTYGSATGTAVERVTGVLDYARDTARVERSADVPRGFPEAAAAGLGREPGDRARQVYAVEKNDVSYRTSLGTWLRYDASGSLEFADNVGNFMEYAGEAAPWGRTLAEVVRHANPERQPVPTPDGGRRYEVDVDVRSAAEALPHSLAYAFVGTKTADEVPLTVVLDKDGRLLRAEADYRSVLGTLRGQDVLKGVTSLRAEYVLTGHGGQKVPPVPAGEPVEDAERVTVTLPALKAGACASYDTGLGHLSLVRPVPCGKDADLRVFGQERIDETFKGQDPSGVGDRLASERCEKAYRKAPAAWTSGGRTSGRYWVAGDESLTFTYVGPDATVTGDFTCYVRLR